MGSERGRLALGGFLKWGLRLRWVNQIPNTITITRPLIGAVSAFYLYHGHSWIALSLFIIAILTDALDGWFARTFHCITKRGMGLDPFCDKILILLMFGASCIVVSYWIIIPTVLIAAREIDVTCLRFRAKRHGKAIAAILSGKKKMFFQCVAVIVIILPFRNYIWLTGASLALAVTLYWTFYSWHEYRNNFNYSRTQNSEVKAVTD